MMTYIVGILMFALAALIVIRFMQKYREATGTSKDRFMAAFNYSGTIVIQRFVALCASMVGGLVWLADLLNAPGISAAIQAYLKPEYVAVFMISLAVLTEIVRRRKGSQDPVN